MREIQKSELADILEKHSKWLHEEAEGERANLSEANLSGANLSGANLSRANLSGANLNWANLSVANLSEAEGIYSIQLSAHPIVVWFNPESNTHMVKVGCEEHSIGDWLANHESIGRKNYYTELQCEEYGIQLQAIKHLIQLWTTGESE